MWYLDGVETGAIEAVRLDGHALTFVLLNITFRGSLVGEELNLDGAVKYGSAFSFVVKRTSADPGELPVSVRNAAPAGAQPPRPRDAAPDAVYLAHAVSAGEGSSTDPSLRRGTLLLVGGGAGQEDINARFVALAGGVSAARIVYVPTAADLPHTSIPQRARNAARVLGVKRVAVLHTVSRREADSEAFVQPIREATGIWIDGGEETALIDAYMGTRTERELIALLDRGGVVGGTSAGALISGSKMVVARQGSHLKVYERAGVEEIAIGDVHEAGIGLLRNVLLIPHFTESRMEKVLMAVVSANPGLLGLGLDEATALEVHGDVFTVLGRGGVCVLDSRPDGGSNRLALESGSRYDIRRRALLPRGEVRR
ncbi:MAG TPA: cyanophycinase [Thermoanaerobaculia bacterium]